MNTSTDDADNPDDEQECRILIGPWDGKDGFCNLQFSSSNPDPVVHRRFDVLTRYSSTSQCPIPYSKSLAYTLQQSPRLYTPTRSPLRVSLIFQG